MTTRSATPPDTASRVWTALHEFVTGQDRRRALHAALDLGPAKVELLIKLADGPMTLREIAHAVAADLAPDQRGTAMRSTAATRPGSPRRPRR